MATRQGLDASIVNRLGADQQAYFLLLKQSLIQMIS
jgi:hypothetical protein